MRTDLEPLSLWNRFQKAFKSTVENCGAQDLVRAWLKQGNRTEFISNFLPSLASALGLELERELWKADFAISIVSKTGVKVPVIFIESENNIRDVAGPSGEVRKLCCHSAPLKVLITVGQWDETPGVWKGRSVRSECLRRWQEIVREHVLVWPHRGLFGMVVGEWLDLSGTTTGRLRFYANAIQPDGSLLSPEIDNIIFERQPLSYEPIHLR